MATRSWSVCRTFFYVFLSAPFIIIIMPSRRVNSIRFDYHACHFSYSFAVIIISFLDIFLHHVVRISNKYWNWNITSPKTSSWLWDFFVFFHANLFFLVFLFSPFLRVYEEKICWRRWPSLESFPWWYDMMIGEKRNKVREWANRTEFEFFVFHFGEFWIFRELEQ